MRPVDTGNAPQAYVTQATANFSFRANNAHALRTLLPAQVIRANQLSANNGLLYLRQYAPSPNPVQNALEVALTTSIKGSMAKRYQKAARHLITATGAYCAYCESPVQQGMQVEHLIPKAIFTTTSLSWDNFLPSCGPCNTKKGARPNDMDIAGLPFPPPAAPVPPDAAYDTQVLQAIKTPGNVLLPNTAGRPFRNLPSKLRFFDTTTNTWQDVGTPAMYDIAITVVTVDYTNQSIIASLPNAPSFLNIAVAVDPINPAALLLNDMVGLNDFGNPRIMYDRRVIRRTDVWCTVLDLLSQIANARTQADLNLIVANIYNLAQTMGCWSIWAQILDQFIMPGVPDTLGYLFAHDPIINRTFPGTDLNNL